MRNKIKLESGVSHLYAACLKKEYFLVYLINKRFVCFFFIFKFESLQYFRKSKGLNQE